MENIINSFNDTAETTLALSVLVGAFLTSSLFLLLFIYGIPELANSTHKDASPEEKIANTEIINNRSINSR